MCNSIYCGEMEELMPCSSDPKIPTPPKEEQETTNWKLTQPESLPQSMQILMKRQFKWATTPDWAKIWIKKRLGIPMLAITDKHNNKEAIIFDCTDYTLLIYQRNVEIKNGFPLE